MRSAGGSWKTSSRGRKRYSTGSGNSFAARNITESLPICRSMLCIASNEPRASPSGPSCVVSRNRSLVSQLLDDAVEIGDQGGRRLAHSPSSSSRARRTPRSGPSS